MIAFIILNFELLHQFNALVFHYTKVTYTLKYPIKILIIIESVDSISMDGPDMPICVTHYNKQKAQHRYSFTFSFCDHS